MTNAVLEITGLGHVQADEGIPINSLPVVSGSKGIVTDFSIIWGGDELPELDLSIGLQGFPYPGAGAIATGTDSNGSIAVAKSFTIGADDTQWSTTSGNLVLADGFWASEVRVFISDITGTRRVRIDILVLELSDLTETLADIPENLASANETWDPTGGLEEDGEGSVDLTWTFDNALAEDPDGFAVIRDGQIVGTVPFESGEENYDFTDFVDTEGIYSYTIVTYKYGSPNVMSPPSSPPVDVEFAGGVSPDISVVSDMALALDWNSIMAFITDPSGIYGLIPNKTHDTLYNRNAEETSINVKIPDPFIRTAFFPEE